MEFVQKFTPLDFQAKNYTPSISPNFNSFSKKKTQKNEWKWRKLRRWQKFYTAASDGMDKFHLCTDPYKLSVWSELTGRKGRQEGWRRSLPPWSGPGSSPSGSRGQACSVGAENSPFLHLCYPLILRSTRIKDPLHCLIHITTDFKLSFHYPQHLIPLPWKQAPRVRPVELEEKLWLGSRSSMSNSPERISFHLVKLKVQPWCMWESMWQSW